MATINKLAANIASAFLTLIFLYCYGSTQKVEMQRKVPPEILMKIPMVRGPDDERQFPRSSPVAFTMAWTNIAIVTSLLEQSLFLYMSASVSASAHLCTIMAHEYEMTPVMVDCRPTARHQKKAWMLMPSCKITGRYLLASSVNAFQEWIYTPSLTIIMDYSMSWLWSIMILSMNMTHRKVVPTIIQQYGLFSYSIRLCLMGLSDGPARAMLKLCVASGMMCRRERERNRLPENVRAVERMFLFWNILSREMSLPKRRTSRKIKKPLTIFTQSMSSIENNRKLKGQHNSRFFNVQVLDLSCWPSANIKCLDDV